MFTTQGIVYVQHVYPAGVLMGFHLPWLPAILRTSISGCGGEFAFANDVRLVLLCLSVAYNRQVGIGRFVRIEYLNQAWRLNIKAGTGKYLRLRRAAEDADPWGMYNVVEHCQNGDSCALSASASAIVTVAGTTIGAT